MVAQRASIVRTIVIVAIASQGCLAALAQDALILIDAMNVRHRVSPLLTGACIEDVNHEIYGGLYSQMIFGESFQEPASASPVEGLIAYGGDWRVADGVLESAAGDGNKIVSESLRVADGLISVDVRFNDDVAGNAGLIVRTTKPGVGADRFFGYEIALDPARQILRLGRHRNDFSLLRDVPCTIPTGEWIELRVRLVGTEIEVLVNGTSILAFDDAGPHALAEGVVGLRQFHRSAQYRNLMAETGSRTMHIPFVQRAVPHEAVSRMWRAIRKGDAQAGYELREKNPFVGTQSQHVAFVAGDGEVGISNAGLNAWGLYLQQGKPYEGEVFVRAEQPCDFWVGVESADGSQVLDEQRFRADSRNWTKIEFTLAPTRTVRDGRFTLKLRDLGAVTFGYVFLQPGAWGRYKDLPVRRDVAEMLKRQGITALRYGGSMVNNNEYRWQKMIGRRARRPPYDGHWYDYSTNGWGILDFMSFCEAAGFEYIPAFNMDETPQSLADFVAYATAGADTEWGRKRVRDGHPRPYRLKYLQLGNEERVDLDYAKRFEARANAIWQVDPQIQLVVGDFVYDDIIRDANRVTGAASGITTLDGQRRILEFAKAAGHEVWFDLHVWTEGPGRHPSLAGALSFIDALEKMETGAAFKVVFFEFNANNHQQRRAIGNALAIHAVERDGRVPIALSANCLQPDGQNDNGWDQGLVFLSPSHVWLQPPGIVTQMLSQEFRPRLVECTVADDAQLDCNAKLSDDGKSLLCSVVNASHEAVRATIRIDGYVPARAIAAITQLSAPLQATNTASAPQAVTPQRRDWRFGSLKDGANLEIAPHSVTTIVFE
jgi:hypothetical protein